jgi:ABC-type ATPase with predicted acetyltransferase domain
MENESSIEINIGITDDFRCFKKGKNFSIPVILNNVNYIVGENGCGKSTVLKKIRCEKDSLKKDLKKMFDGVYSNSIRFMAGEPIEITGVNENFDNVFCLDVVEDNPTSFTNVTTATALINGGGLTAGRVSNGEKSKNLISRFILQIQKAAGFTIDDHRNGKRITDRKSLVIVDEVDEGMDLKSMFSFDHLLRNLCRVFNATVLCVTHNPFVCLGDPARDKTPVFNMEDKSMTTIGEYIERKTGYILTLTKTENDKEA